MHNFCVPLDLIMSSNLVFESYWTAAWIDVFYAGPILGRRVVHSRMVNYGLIKEVCGLSQRKMEMKMWVLDGQLLLLLFVPVLLWNVPYFCIADLHWSVCISSLVNLVITFLNYPFYGMHCAHATHTRDLYLSKNWFSISGKPWRTNVDLTCM
jgi:hypothetical protein